MDLLTISKQYANSRAGLPLGTNLNPGSTTTFTGNFFVNGSLTGQNLQIGSSVSQCAISSTGILQMSGTTSGTLLQLLSKTDPVPEFAALGVSVGTSLDVYALNSHKWWLGSSPNSSGSGVMQLSAGSLTVGGNVYANTVTSRALAFSGSTSGTLVQLVNNVATIAGSVTTAFAAIGVSLGTALDNYALTSHRWWTGSSGTSSGTVGMQLSNAGLNVANPVITPNNFWGRFSIIQTNQTWQTTPITYTLNQGNMTLSSSSQVLIPCTGHYSISLNFDVSSALINEIVIYVNTTDSINRLVNRWQGGSNFPDRRFSVSVTSTLAAGDLLSAYMTSSGTTQIANEFSRGLTIALISRLS